MRIGKAKIDYRKASLIRDVESDMSMELQLTIPRSTFEMWQGIKAAHGLNEDFLQFVLGRLMTHTLIQYVQITEFGG